MIFKKQAEEDFDIQAAEFPEMESLINRCANIYRGVPEWLDDKNNIKTINFAKSVCSETARLATLAIGIQIDGSARATWLQEQINKVYFQIRHWVEYFTFHNVSINTTRFMCFLYDFTTLHSIMFLLIQGTAVSLDKRSYLYIP